jgi:pyridoxamine 5'-phosphate oxidase family protein
VSVFSQAELSYLAECRLGRLATSIRTAGPTWSPLGWSYNQALDTIDIGGREFAKTRKFRDARDNPKVTLVIDDVLPPWRPRAVMVRGDGETLTEAVDTQPVPSSRPHTSAVRVAGTVAAVGAAVTVWLLARFGAR